MAILVPMRSGADAVTAEIAIEGIVFWHVLYVADDTELAKSGTSAETNELELGVPDKLNLDVNTWHIVLMNPTKSTVPYSVGISWTQKGNDIASWPEKGPNKGSLKPGDNVVLDDSAFLAIVPETTKKKGAK